MAKKYLCQMCGTNEVGDSNHVCGACRAKPSKKSAALRASTNARAYLTKLAVEANSNDKEAQKTLEQLAGSKKKAEQLKKENRDRAAGGKWFRRAK